MRKTYLIFFMLVSMLGALSSCQKDNNVKENAEVKAAAAADSSIAAVPGNNLAVTGTLSIKIQDSTYVFDAARDSIAFINVHDDSDDKSRYFGITAINKEHTMSFGISSPGYVLANKESNVAGSQLLLLPADKKTTLQYSLSKYAGPKEFGKLYIEKYSQDSVLAKGTFTAAFARDDKAGSPIFKAEGSFNLRLK